MKKLMLFAVLLSAGFASEPRAQVVASGQWKNDSYNLWLEGVEDGAWQPEKSEPPLSVTNAVVIARKALTEMVGAEATHMFCSNITITPGSGRYCVTFTTIPTKAAFGGKNSFKPTVMPFAVFADGTVSKPVKGGSQN